MNTTGSVALITGGARRVGRAIALSLAEAGCDVAVHYHTSEADAASLADSIVALGRRCALVRGNLAQTRTPGQLVSATVEQLGRLDVLVNNASVFGAMSLDAFTPKGWDQELRINLTAVAALCHHARPHLQAARPGKIVNLCDISAERPWPEHLAYCVSKAGVACLTRALARELAPNVQVNGVAPGIAVFPESYDQATRQALISKVPLRRAGRPEDIAAAVRYLVQNGDYVTGQILAVDGGRSVT